MDRKNADVEELQNVKCEEIIDQLNVDGCGSLLTFFSSLLLAGKTSNENFKNITFLALFLQI